MHDAAEAIYDPRAIEVDPGRRLVGHRMVGRATGEGFKRLLVRTGPDGLEQRVAPCGPSERVLLGRVPVRAAARSSCDVVGHSSGRRGRRPWLWTKHSANQRLPQGVCVEVSPAWSNRPGRDPSAVASLTQCGIIGSCRRTDTVALARGEERASSTACYAGGPGFSRWAACGRTRLPRRTASSPRNASACASDVVPP